MNKVFIDSGHNYSGGDTGAVGNGYREQDVTWEVGSRLGALLVKHGFEVRYSRLNKTDNVGTDVSTSINGRVNMANSWEADLFISLHCNAASASALGTETLVHSLSGKARELADRVQTSVVKLCYMVDRGVKQRTDLGVLKNTNMPAILVEIGFISNEGDCNKMVSNPNTFAEAIVKGICEYTGVKNTDAGNATQVKEVGTVIETKEQALKLLVEKGVINSPDYWNKVSDVVTYFDKFLINVANKLCE